MPEHTSIRRLASLSADFDSELAALLNRDSGTLTAVDATAAGIIADVRKRGDAALFEYTKKFDDFDLQADSIEVSSDRLQQAFETINAEERGALEYAARRIRRFHEQQLEKSWSIEESDGTSLGQKITPIARVGMYVPGGKASYPSSVLMNAIPAKVAGVKELVVVSPSPQGQVNEMVLAAASIAGVDRFLRIGGAQAIAALAYGTESVSAVDKITGPGNAYVASAKKQVFGQVGIDMIAGPSEVLVIADNSVDPDWVAMDLFAQAEHDENAQSILLTLDAQFADQVEASIKKLLPEMPRSAIIAESLSRHGCVIVAQNKEELVRIADVIAPEHLEIMVPEAIVLAERISNAGAIFVGAFSAESLGDYCAGPNHVLPTSGTARFSSPLGVYDFLKRTSIIHISEEGAQQIGRQASILAKAESLSAHSRSAEFRLKK